MRSVLQHGDPRALSDEKLEGICARSAIEIQREFGKGSNVSFNEILELGRNLFRK
jgi:hypothetical protein